MFPDRSDPSHWQLTWKLSKNLVFNVGDVFILDPYGRMKDIGVFRVRTIKLEGGLTPLEALNSNRTGWIGGHAWDFTDEKTLVKLWFYNQKLTEKKRDVMSVSADISSWKAWAHNVPGECPCGIKRIDCGYHR